MAAVGAKRDMSEYIELKTEFKNMREHMVRMETAQSNAAERTATQMEKLAEDLHMLVQLQERSRNIETQLSVANTSITDLRDELREGLKRAHDRVDSILPKLSFMEHQLVAIKGTAESALERTKSTRAGSWDIAKLAIASLLSASLGMCAYVYNANQDEMKSLRTRDTHEAPVAPSERRGVRGND